MGLMGNDEASFRHLTNTILHDYSLTLAVLRLANSAYYNRSGQPIASVARAVTMIGIEAIKRLAAGLMLLENYEKRDSGIKELLLLAMLTASHTRQSAMRMKLPDVEKAYLCGMFRNMGEILVALYFHEAYEKIQKLIHERKLTEREACMKVLDFTYEDLARTVGSSWNLPGTVLQAMGPADPLKYSEGTEDDKLRTLAAFSHELTVCVYRHPPADRNKALDNLIEKYNALPDLDHKVVKGLLDEAVTETKETFTTVGVPLNDLYLRRQHTVALTGEQAPKGSNGTTLATATESAGPAAAHAPPGEPAVGGDPAGGGDLLSRLVAEVKTAMEPGHELKLNEVLMMAMEACHRGAQFDRVVFCLATPDRSMVRGRLGLGESIDEVIEQIQIPLSGQQEALTLALLTKRDLFIDLERDDRYQSSNLIRSLKATCFALYPVMVDNVIVGCLYCDRLKPNSFPPQAIFDTVGQLRDLLAELIRRTRQRT
jgi:HD-like signal output (HDOD) protein